MRLFKPSIFFVLCIISLLGIAPSQAIQPDADGDSMDDNWELAHGLNPADPDDANLDGDNDGYTNLEEYQLGLDPNVFNPQPAAVAGWGHSLILKANGSVWAVGMNVDGQLGDGTNIERGEPVLVGSLNGVVIQVAAGTAHSVAVKSDGTVWCWGKGTSGQLGNGLGSNSTTPVQVAGLSNIVAVSAGDAHTIALKSDGSVWAWGDNSQGQLGDGTIVKKFTPVQVLGIGGSGFLNNIVAISAGHSFSMALRNDGSVLTWGSNDRGQLGDGIISIRVTPDVVNGASGVNKIAAGAGHCLALKSDGTVLSWGANAIGLPDGYEFVDSSVPVVVPTLSGIIEIAAGDSHNLALKNDGTIKTWGYGAYGQIGNGKTGNITAASVLNLSDVIAVASGSVANHSLAISSNGAVVAWGDNRYNQLGDRPVIANTSPLVVSSISNVVELAMSGTRSFTLAKKADGSIWTWGLDDDGQLGDGNNFFSALPVKVLGDGGAGFLTGVKQLSAGHAHSLVLKSNGTVRAWGYGGYGQLGNGSNGSSLTPVAPQNLNGIVDIASEAVSTVTLKNDGSVWTYGNNAQGRLGDGTTIDRNTPVQVVGPGGNGYLTGIVNVAAGYYYGAALKNDGTVWTWGAGDNGVLGIGSNANSSTPVQVLGAGGVGFLTNIEALYAGNVQLVAIENNGTLWTWGRFVTLPTKLSGPGFLDNVVAVALGGWHAMFLQGDGSVWSYGSNGGGQLGNGNTLDQSIPTQVLGLEGIVNIYAGANGSMALKEDGTLFAWGASDTYELGTGASNKNLVPTVIAGINVYENVLQASLSGAQSNGVIGTAQTLTANVTPAGIPVAKVEFYNERIKIGEAVNAPYTFQWKPPTWGTFHLSAVAFDVEGNCSKRSEVPPVTVPFDSDGNGLPDWFEVKYFGQVGVNPNSDPDGDSLLNIEEYQSGSNPTAFSTSGDGLPDGWKKFYGLDLFMDYSAISIGGIPVKEIAIPTNPALGPLSVSITSPANGTTIP